jgi:hypothetical protein
MTLTYPTDLCQRRVRLTREPASVAVARNQVRAAIGDWAVSVDTDIAIVLTSDLVTDAIVHGQGATITLAIRCSRSQLRIDVYDTSRALPVTVTEPDGRHSGHLLVLVAALSAEWGSFHTPVGHAAYFALSFQPDLYRPPRRPH